ncbi:sorbitol dehydrogenase [Nephila pilipes]|uniref:Sorbitol dehydrogenase n=1 Tax=Nephila pilipes TaxID=299642 RepID=A0A8X6UI33_NEPPI|nr:sorbitol dehydrogenase [Nephila pilipes]
MTTKNLCAVLKGKGDLCLENRPVPVPLPNEVLIAVHTVGICGSDIHLWKHGGIGNFTIQNPIVLGHESSGVVVKTGSLVKHLKPDLYWKLNQRKHLLISNFNEKLPSNVSLEEGSLMEPLAVAVHACRRAEITAGKSVLICGAGAIGLVNLLTCKAMGATKICITDISEKRLEIAKTLGATHQICVKDVDTKTAAEQIKSKLGGSPDVTLECSGAEVSLRLAIKVAKSGGVVMMVGLGASEITIPIIEATVREVDIKGIYRYANCFPIALELVSSGAINVKPIITNLFHIEDVHKAFETAQLGTDGAIKVLVRCQLT